LIHKGADVNQAGINEITPLICALHHNQIEVARLLLRNELDIENEKLILKKHEALELIEILDILCSEMKE
jgi:ankyrin repeat protein